MRSKFACLTNTYHTISIYAEGMQMDYFVKVNQEELYYDARKRMSFVIADLADKRRQPKLHNFLSYLPSAIQYCMTSIES